jgi:hypothetical protein
MKPGVLEKATQLATKVGYVLIATADSDGWPHVAAARTLTLDGEGRVAVNEWFCPGTIANLHSNSRVSIVVWDQKSDTGYQLLGRMERLKDIDMLDGYTPGQRSSTLSRRWRASWSLT